MNLEVLGEAGAIVMVDAVKSKIETASRTRAPVPLTPTTMSLSASLERLSNYRIKNTRASRDIFDTGLPIFEQRLDSLGDESATFVPPTALRSGLTGNIRVDFPRTVCACRC